MKNKHGYIYFISDGKGHIKIGVSNDPERRLDQLQTGNVNQLKMLYILEVNSMEEAYDVEAILHGMFRKYRCNGEWFEEKKVLSFLNKPWLKIGDYEFKGLGSRVWKNLSIVMIIGMIVAALDFIAKLFAG